MTEVGFSKSGSTCTSVGSRSAAEGNPPTLKMFERADWTLFRTVEGLQQKAGVCATRLRRLVLKELADNGLDVGRIKYGGGGGSYFIEDDGPGLDGTPIEIAELFSIRRPLRSSKLLRLPQRGQLGNGLRVVAGAVLASGGSLTVITRNRRIVLRPVSDGSTTVVEITPAKQPAGTRIEIGFGPELPNDSFVFDWVQAAQAVATAGESYQGRSSPFWYDAAQFHELVLACGGQPVRSLVAQLDGCTGGKAGEIVAAAGLDRKRCQDIDRAQATKLLRIAREHGRLVSPDRLGYVGREPFPESHYAKECGGAALGSGEPRAEVPFVVEVWARKVGGNKGTDAIAVSVLVNRTPITAEVSAFRDSDGLNLMGAGLSHYCADVPKKGLFRLRVNLITPYCPITSDGKEPDLEPFAGSILLAISNAMRKAQRAAPKDKKVSQKDVVLDHLDDARGSQRRRRLSLQRTANLLSAPADRAGPDRPRAADRQLQAHHHRLRKRARRDRRDVPRAARLDLSPTHRRGHSARHAHGRGL
jgi:hypothetical protein